MFYSVTMLHAIRHT